jgi:hypothetical protein
MQQLILRIGSLLAFLPLLIGCGPSGRPKIATVPISGNIQVDGKPFANAKVNFLTSEYAGIAETDASGNFTMEAQPGENTVFIVKYSDPNFDETMIGGSDTPSSAPKQVLPDKFSDATKTELRFTVPDGGTTEANFDLKSR